MVSTRKEVNRACEREEFHSCESGMTPGGSGESKKRKEEGDQNSLGEQEADSIAGKETGVNSNKKRNLKPGLHVVLQYHGKTTQRF